MLRLDATLSSNAYVECRGLGVTICCLGPIATGTAEQPRNVYGASGLQPAVDSGSNRLSDTEAAAWLGAAIHHRLDRVWISKQPVLSLGAQRSVHAQPRLSAISACLHSAQSRAAGYAMQYLPSAAMLLLKRIGPARARALKAGKSGYVVSELTKARTSAES
jgi:dehydrogenase/reductase SDR family protein 7